jgi:hypothetical protein
VPASGSTGDQQLSVGELRGPCVGLELAELADVFAGSAGKSR